MTAQVPCTDARARVIINKEALQLPADGAGVIAINLSNGLGGMKFWPKAARRFFSRGGHIRVSGVLLYSAPPAFENCEVTKELVLDPHAKKPLAESAREAIITFGDGWPYIARSALRGK